MSRSTALVGHKDACGRYFSRIGIVKSSSARGPQQLSSGRQPATKSSDVARCVTNSSPASSIRPLPHRRRGGRGNGGGAPFQSTKTPPPRAGDSGGGGDLRAGPARRGGDVAGRARGHPVPPPPPRGPGGAPRLPRRVVYLGQPEV